MSGSGFAWLLRRLDRMLRWRQGIFEFTDDPQCVFRVSVAPAGRALTLSDGAAIRPEDRVAQIHYWNEHLPLIPDAGHDATWASQFHRRVVHSLGLTAELLARDPRFADVAAIFAAPAFSADAGASITARISRRLGYDVLDEPPHLNPVHRWLDSFLVWNLMRIYNPVSTRGRGLAHGRVHVWMSRRTLLARYLAPQRADAHTAALMEQP
jgi:hypothetical protein